MIFPIFQCNEASDDFIPGHWYPYQAGAELVKYDGEYLYVQLNGVEKITAHKSGEVFANIEAAIAECKTRNVVVPSKPTVWICNALCITEPHRTFVAAVKSTKEAAIKFATKNMDGAHFQVGKWIWFLTGWQVDSEINAPFDYTNLPITEQPHGVPKQDTSDHQPDQNTGSSKTEKSDKKRGCTWRS